MGWIHAIEGKTWCRCCAALLVMALAGISDSHAEEKLSISLAANDYPPLIAQNEPGGGSMSRLVVEAFRRTDVDVKITYVPNNRAISGVMLGLYDGSYGWAHAEDRDRKLLYSSTPIYTFRMVFFERRGANIAWKSLAELAPYKIGATLGDHYSDEFSALQASGKLHVDFANDDLANMRKLLVGRVDLFAMEESAGYTLIHDSFAPADQEKFAAQANAISAVPSFFVVNRGNPRGRELIERFERGLRLLAQSGELNKVLGEGDLSGYKALVHSLELEHH
jgi:polar amino acid transport system substrate-binding protein